MKLLEEPPRGAGSSSRRSSAAWLTWSAWLTAPVWLAVLMLVVSVGDLLRRR